MTLFIPNTYEFFWNQNAEQFMERMAKEHQKFWKKNKRLRKAKKVGLSPEEVYTLASIVERETLEYDGGHIVDLGGGYSICAIDTASCTDIKVRNNIAAGVVYAGFVTVGHECGDYNKFDGNVAHSVKGL